jgi:serine/threonine-protein kinase HipA
MKRELLVFMEMAGETVPVGRLWTRTRGARQTASFEYDPSWLERRDAFGLDPVLPPARGQFHTDRPLFNVFTDPAPDRWGQTLLRRNERRRARAEGRQPRTLLAVDFLTLVDDETRLGALRFKDAGGGDFLTSTGKRVPPVVDLPRLLSATERIIEDRETDEDLQLILAPGTSLGGARPKASLRDKDGHLLIAKFPRKDDEWPVTRWEAAAMALAEAAGVEVSPWRLQLVSKRPVLMARRFDRLEGRRIPYMSALTALDASDNEARSYLEIAEFLRRDGSRVNQDLRQLWRRILFNMLVSNTDDHLRNHGFLRDPKGWRLAPAYDLNPMPTDVKPRIHALAIDEIDGTASLDTAFEIVPMFGMTEKDARAIAAEVGSAVAGWRDAAARFGITSDEVERMASAFDHEDLKAVTSNRIFDKPTRKKAAPKRPG